MTEHHEMLKFATEVSQDIALIFVGCALVGLQWQVNALWRLVQKLEKTAEPRSTEEP